MSENILPFYGGKAFVEFLTENEVFYNRELENKACLFAEKNEKAVRVYYLDYTVGLFLLNEREIRIFKDAKIVSAKVLDSLNWQELQILKRYSQIVVVNYFKHYADLIDNFPELNEYEAVVMQAEDYRKQASVSHLTQKYFWQFVETAFIFGLSSSYSEAGVRLDFSQNQQITAGRAKKQLKILQENDFLRFTEAGTKAFHLKFNKHALHINFLNAPRFFKYLIYDDVLYEAKNQTDIVTENEEKYESETKRLQKNIIRKKRKSNLERVVTEAQFLAQYQNQVELGKISEKRVMDFEIKHLLEKEKSELAAKVKSVADRPAYGFDIISYEPDGTEKQIEVKTIQRRGESSSFIITANELEKSRKLPNYYLYCVENPYSENATISFFRQPDFQDSQFFNVEPLSFQISFQVKDKPQ